MFIDYRLAIGMLVVAGFKIEWHNNQIIDLRDNEPVCFCFRDGTTWKVKEQVIADYISGVETAKCPI